MPNIEGGPENAGPATLLGVLAPGSRFTRAAVALTYMKIIRIHAHDFEPAFQQHKACQPARRC